MKKTILVPLLLTATIGISEPLIFKSTINDKFLISKQEQIISKNAKQSFNPTAPSFTKNINWDNNIDVETGGTWSADYTEKVESPYYYINILDYASSWSDFKNKYSQIRIDYEGYVDHSMADMVDYNAYHYINLSQISANEKTSQIFNSYAGYTQNEGQGWTEVRYQLENNQLKIDFLVYAYAGNGWNSMNTWAKTWLKVNSLFFNTSFSFSEMKDNLTKELNKELSYYSNIDNNPQSANNWNQIKTEMDSKIRKALNDNNDTQGWIEFLNPNYQLEKRNNNYYLKTSFNIENYQNGSSEIWEFKTPLNFNSDYNIANAKNRIENELKQTIIYQSDTSTNILDKTNWNAIKTILDNKIFNVLSKKGSIIEWKKLIKPNYALITENNNYYLKTSFNIFNHLTEQWENWVFKTKLNFSLSAKYWKSKIQERILITPGKISDEKGIEMINDVEEVINNGEGKENKYNKGIIKYHTTTFFQYIEPKENNNDPDYDIVKINGVNLNAVNGLYTYTFDDKEKVNKYEIEIIHRPNPKIDGDIGGNFKLTILIETITPSLQLKLMGWGPKNIDYEKLTNEFIKDPSNENKSIKNPNYDKEINKETGTKKQLIWIRHQSNSPFPLDPIDKDGNLIKTSNINDYDIGYLAEASAVGAGFENFYNNDNIEKVIRYLSNEKLNTKFENGYQLEKSKTGDVNTSAGWFHFIIQQKRFNDLNGNTQTPFYQHKFIYVDKNKSSNYGYFLNSIDSQDAGDFWNTTQGRHLKNYMINYKKWNTDNDLAKLNYEAVLSYWRDYVSDIRNHLAVNESINNFKALNDLNISALKMNVKDIKTIKDKINKYVWQEINKLSLLATINKDYIIQIYKNSQWQKLTDDDLNQLITNQQEQTKAITIKIKALNTSMFLIGETNQFKVINNLNYDESKVIDLSKIKYKNQEYNFKDKTKDNIFNNYIMEYIKQGFKINKLDEILKQDIDYQISLQGVNGGKININDNELQEFMKKIQENKYSELKITIYALDDSLKVIGNISYKLINNPITENAPSKPNEIPPTEGIIPNIPNKPMNPNNPNGNNGNGDNNNPNKPEKPNKPMNPNHNENNESGWKKFFKKPVNLFFMTLISCGIVGGFITWIIIKNQLNKKIGGKIDKKSKNKKKIKKQ
ncbi:Mbov_0399 family ICE element protein [Spiroplasma endosymbiont of Calodromius spilotus]|uniref:Mbov_0399 family ICE element protein n=1 Tax=Spiroplasma endosymbiont of Calodromius spilotus TaxID=3077929 RepID=UPI0031FECB97